jgi:hypothetical protein
MLPVCIQRSKADEYSSLANENVLFSQNIYVCFINPQNIKYVSDQFPIDLRVLFHKLKQRNGIPHLRL